MEWSHYTFAEAIHRTTRLVLKNNRLSVSEKADHLHHLLCLMVKRLPEDWGTETRKVLKVKDCKAESILEALDVDLQQTGFQPEQYAVFGALRQLILTLRHLRQLSQGSEESKNVPNNELMNKGYSGSHTTA